MARPSHRLANQRDCQVNELTLDGKKHDAGDSTLKTQGIREGNRESPGNVQLQDWVKYPGAAYRLL